MKIKVTKEDIDCAEDGGTCCPIAQALKRMYTDKDDIFVRVTSIRINEQMIRLPQIAIDFINRFDQDRIVHPFEFETI